MKNLEIQMCVPTYGTIPYGEGRKMEHLKLTLAKQLLKKGYKLLAISRNSPGHLHPIFVRESLNENLEIDSSFEIKRFYETYGCNIGYDEKGWRYCFIATDMNDVYQEYIVKKFKLKEDENESL